MGEARWKETMEKENKHMGMGCAKAFAHALLSNNYFAWLLDYRITNAAGNAASKVKTECNLKDDDNEEQ